MKGNIGSGAGQAIHLRIALWVGVWQSLEAMPVVILLFLVWLIGLTREETHAVFSLHRMAGARGVSH